MLFSNTTNISELNATVLIKDHHHLKTRVRPEHLGLNKFAQVKIHLDGVIDCRTKDHYNQHKANLYKALANRPRDVEYFRGYLDHPESIARYKIMEVRGGLGMVSSSNAEAGHASNEHAVPTQLMGVVDIEKQILKLLEREDC